METMRDDRLYKKRMDRKLFDLAKLANEDVLPSVLRPDLQQSQVLHNYPDRTSKQAFSVTAFTMFTIPCTIKCLNMLNFSSGNLNACIDLQMNQIDRSI